MVAPALFRISVYNGDRVFQCQIGSPSELKVTVRHNLPGTLTMTVPLSHRRALVLLEPKTRLVVLFRGEHLISGPITEKEIGTDGVAGTLTVTVEDDLRVLKEILGWQVPAAAISAQGTAEFRKYTGNAEGIVKVAVTENGVNRLGIPGLTTATNLARGVSVPGGLSYRMHPLADLLFPAVATAGLGVTVKQDGTSLVLDVHEPVTYGRTLSVDGRTLKNVQMVSARPKASRAVVGGAGEGRDRYFRVVTDTAREAIYGFCGEVFVDAASTGSDYTKLLKDTADAAKDLKDANNDLTKADNALDAANMAYENADQAYDTALATGTSSLISSATSRRNTAQSKVTSRLADYNTALADRNTKQTAYNTLLASQPAALADYQAAMDEEGNKALTENGISNGVAITLAEAGIFKYGPGGFHVGDKVPIKITDDITVTEVIKECTIQWVSTNHASVDPVVGDRLDQPERITQKRLQALARGQRDMRNR